MRNHVFVEQESGVRVGRITGGRRSIIKTHSAYTDKQPLAA